MAESGLRRSLGKRVCGKPYRGFESPSLRQEMTLLRTEAPDYSVFKVGGASRLNYRGSKAKQPERMNSALLGQGGCEDEWSDGLQRLYRIRAILSRPRQGISFWPSGEIGETQQA